jgi:hypothetical protein
MDRRAFLRLGLWSGMGLATVSTTALLSGCSSPTTAQGFQFLRDGDVTLFRALIPAILKGALPEDATQAQAVDDTLHSLDGVLYYSSLAGHKQLQQLFDLITFPPTRLLLGGLGHSWDKASTADANAFLERWRGSSVGLLRSAHKGLLQMTEMSWYLQPRSWAAIGYVPPVKIVEA